MNEKKTTTILYSLLGIVCFFSFFCLLGSYPLLEVDETRYVDMAREMFRTKDFLTLYLNGDFFFEKPPLFFWIECFSFKLTGIVSELTARLPIVLLSLMPAAFLFFLTKKVKGSRFAVITTLTLFTSFEYIFLTKIAILDSVLTSFVVSSVLAYFYTFYVEDKHKKYFWGLTYVLSGLAVLAKGIPGVVIPMFVIAVASVVFKTYKETLKYSWGLLIFLGIILPWHIIMLKMHGTLFFEEYIIKHHILRFLGSDIIHKNQPWYFYLVTLLWGLFPHVIVLLSQLTKLKEIKFNDKFLTLNFIAVITILLFFSASGAKLVTYILPIYPFLAVIVGQIWTDFINKNDKSVRYSLIFLNSLFTVATIALFFVKFLMPTELYLAFKPVQITAIVLFVPFVILGWIFLSKQKNLKFFLLLTLFISLLAGILSPKIFEFNYTFGQNDLMRFAKIAKENDYTVSTYLTGRKYSLLYYGNRKLVQFQTENDVDWLKNELKKPNHMVIVRNKFLNGLPVKVTNRGTKFSIVEHN